MRKPLVLFFPKIMCMQSCKNILREAAKKKSSTNGQAIKALPPPPFEPGLYPSPTLLMARPLLEDFFCGFPKQLIMVQKLKSRESTNSVYET